MSLDVDGTIINNTHMPKAILQYGSVFGLIWTLCTCLFYTNLVPRPILYGGLALFLVCWLIELIIDRLWCTKPTREWVFFGLMIAF